MNCGKTCRKKFVRWQKVTTTKQQKSPFAGRRTRIRNSPGNYGIYKIIIELFKFFFNGLVPSSQVLGLRVIIILNDNDLINIFVIQYVSLDV